MLMPDVFTQMFPTTTGVHSTANIYPPTHSLEEITSLGFSTHMPSSSCKSPPGSAGFQPALACLKLGKCPPSYKGSTCDNGSNSTSQPTLFDPALSLSGLKKERRRWLASDVKRYLSKDIEKMEECNKIIRLVRNDVLGIGAKLINFSTRISQFKATYFHRCIQFPMIHVRLKVMYRLHLAPISVNQTPLFLLSLPNQRPKPHPSLRVII